MARPRALTESSCSIIIVSAADSLIYAQGVTLGSASVLHPSEQSVDPTTMLPIWLLAFSQIREYSDGRVFATRWLTPYRAEYPEGWHRCKEVNGETFMWFKAQIFARVF